jgi:hypothetical protein
MLSVTLLRNVRGTLPLRLTKSLVARYAAAADFSRPIQVCQYSDTSNDKYFATQWSEEKQTKGLNDGSPEAHEGSLKYDVPQRVRQKLISAEDAVALVRDEDTVCVSGFVTQGAAELVLRALGQRFEETKSPKNLTLLFGGGPGDYGEKGLSHLAKIADDGTAMLKRTIGGMLCIVDYVSFWSFYNS